jgi:hypothetical protein
VTRKHNTETAWRYCAMVLPACLRSGRDDSFYHQLAIELSPRSGGPPG